MENKVEGGFFPNVMVRQSATILKLLARKDKGLRLLVRRNAKDDS